MTNPENATLTEVQVLTTLRHDYNLSDAELDAVMHALHFDRTATHGDLVITRELAAYTIHTPDTDTPETAPLPQLPTVTASNMLTAQAYRPTPAERAAIIARADFCEAHGVSRTISIKVIDHQGTHIGYLEFNL